MGINPDINMYGWCGECKNGIEMFNKYMENKYYVIQKNMGI